ncbi:GNAT family N-acetyltransferase [Saccharibacillus sp. CPCC 101409]|uniref:GNAT family N-acetyltransferase n=1 Tax=Saccharibacillus sp. CPCC 101409 TaxID=3058041 RepID=UPI002672D21A|nr:GNAT family N-acetyltransferase [Saccharibacillus sp. CPCC 101409]MDO3408496.1 GNAT family N-acetyltransferase [Saccharibacillus sp. CPCC 101409]
MTTIRLLEPQELAEAVRLSDSVFRGGAEVSMGAMFPRLFAPGLVHSYGAFAADGSLAAFMGLAPSTLRVDGAAQTRIRAFSIGSVCTAPEHRGAGLAGRLLERCFVHAAQAEAPLLFVSGDRSLYTRAGCLPFGRTAAAVLRPDGPSGGPGAGRPAPRRASHAPEALPALRLRDAKPEDLQRLHALREAGHAAARFEESAAGLGELLGAAAFANVLGLSQRVILAGVGDAPVAYAVLAVPHHLRNDRPDGAEPVPPAPAESASAPPTVIEYGGSPLHAAALLAVLPQRLGLDELHVSVPWQETGLLGLLREAGAETTPAPNAGTLSAGRIRLLLDQAAPIWSRPWSEVLDADAHGSVFLKSDGRRLDPGEAQGLLLDPESPLRAEVPDWFTPIPLPYAYGLHYV